MFGRKRQLEIAIQALRYYGAEATWKRRGRNDGYQPAPFTTDHGKRARSALERMQVEASRPLLSRVASAFARRPTRLPDFTPSVPPARATAASLSTTE